MRNKNHLIILRFLVLILAVALGYRMYHHQKGSISTKQRNAQVMGTHNEGIPTIGGKFTLIDTKGKNFTHNDLRGKYAIIYFGYTFCPDICPQALINISDALGMLSPHARKQFRTVFISVDYRRDTPETMKKYLKIYPAPIIGLTGTAEQIATVKKKYRVFSRVLDDNKSTDYAIDHSSVVYIMAPNGHFVSHVNHETPASEIMKTLSHVITQNKQQANPVTTRKKT